MSYFRISACFTVPEVDASAAVESTHRFLDGLLLNGVPVLDAEVTSVQICDVEQLESLRKQREQL
jgi:hypothetical protein